METEEIENGRSVTVLAEHSDSELIAPPSKEKKLSPMDLESRDRWMEYSQAKDAMFSHTNSPASPWFTVEADDKKRSSQLHQPLH